MRLFPGVRDFEHRFEVGAWMALDVASQRLEHQDPMATADHLGMHRESVNAFADSIVEIVEIAGPYFIYRTRRCEPVLDSRAAGHVFEGGKIVESPGER